MTNSEAIETLKKASTYLEAKTIIDRLFPDLGHTLKNAGEYRFVENRSVQSMLIKSQISMPVTGLSQMPFLKPNSPNGIAPLLNKAYFAVGNRLYLWDYYDNKDMIVYEEDSDITAVEFVQPKNEVFNASVSQLLVITTTRHMKIVAVSATQFTLIDTDMSTNAAGVVVRKIHGTSEGRIFMLGEDHNLWELVYGREEGWFTGRCYKKLHSSSSLGFISSYFNHSIIDISSDPTGTILYQLTQQSTIIVTWLGYDESFRHLVTMSDVLKQAQLPLNTHIISVHATSLKESRKYQLVAITNAGHRLYFTIYKNELDQDMPTTLSLLHVRQPPPAAAANQGESSAVVLSKTLYQDAVYLAVKTDINNHTDTLIETNPDIGHLSQTDRTNLVEFATNMPVSGKVLALASVPVLGGYDDGYQINEIAAPTTTPARQFLALTTTGLMVLVKQRPIDMLQNLIINSSSDVPVLSEDLLAFLRHYGITNTSALAFGLISNAILTNSNTLITNDNHHNHHHHHHGNSQFQTNALISPAVVQGAKAVLARLKGQTNDPFVNQEGLALFIYRTIRPIWENPVFKPDNTSVNSLPQLRNTLEILRHLSNNILENIDKTPEVEAMYELVNYSSQAIAFFLYLFESDTNTILQPLHPEAHPRLGTISFKELLTTNEGKGYIDRLSNLLIDYELTKTNQNTAFILDALQQHCGDFCNTTNTIISKMIRDIYNNNGTLKQAFITLCKIANRIPDSRLNEINEALIQKEGGHQLAIDLTLACINTHPHDRVYYDIYANLLLLLGQSNPLIKKALFTQNKDLHYLVYEKFIERGRGMDLIKASPLYLEEFLKGQQNTIERVDLLATYYKSIERYEEAAHTLIHLARLPGALSINRRIELLNEAYQCTEKVTAPAKQYEMYELGQTIQNLLDVARQQELVTVA